MSSIPPSNPMSGPIGNGGPAGPLDPRSFSVEPDQPPVLKMAPPKPVIDPAKVAKLAGTGIGTNPDSFLSSVNPSTAPATPTPLTVPADIKAIPSGLFDWRSLAKSWTDAMFSPAPGDNATEVSRKIAGSSDFMNKLEQLGAQSPTGLTPDIVNTIANGYYKSVMTPAPTLTQDQGALGQLQDAYAQHPIKRVADGSDVDPRQALALGGYALANMLTGKGTAADAIRSVNTLQAGDQQRVDDAYQNQTLQDEYQRQLALAQFNRANQISDEQYKQEGYFAHDERTAMRQAQNSLQMLDRQEQLANSRDKANALASLRQFVISGDPVRAGNMVDLITSNYPDIQIPQSIAQLSPTYQQRNVQAQTALTNANTQKVQAATQGIQFKNKLDNDTYAWQVQQVMQHATEGDLKIQKMKLELDHLPQQYKNEAAMTNAKALYYQSRGEAAIKAADAAMVRANRPDDGLKSLANVVRNFNTGIDNQRNQINDWYKQLGAIDKEIRLQVARGAYNSPSELPDQTLVQQKMAIQKSIQLYQQRIEADQSKSNQAIDQIYQVAGPDEP